MGRTGGGANAVVTYQVRQDLSWSLRGEHFSDPDGFILFPTTSSRDDFNAVTTGFRYDVNKNLSLRPALRYDWFDAREHDRPYGNGRDRSQLSTMIEALTASELAVVPSPVDRRGRWFS